MIARLHLDRRLSRPLHEQLMHQLREMILQGELPPGSALPPSRTAARELGVSRNVVVLAYEQLGMEGYLEARVGSGTRVRRSLPGHLLHPPSPSGRDASTTERSGRVRLSEEGRRLAESEGIPIRCGGRPGPFLPGVVGAEHFPTRIWSRIAGRIWRDRPDAVVAYGEAAGYRPLREALADHVRRHRAVRCTADQVMVTSGSQQALDLVARMLVNPGDPVAVEEPGYRGAQIALAATGSRLVPVPVDAEGVALPEDATAFENARLLFITPSHQYPMGVTLPLERRLRLLEWARESDAWIVEDDYDSEFRYESRPLPALQGLDPEGRVIYVGTLSKVLAPGLRAGFLVLPEELVAPFRRARAAADTHSPLILQATLAAFMAEGHLERHIARLRGIYEERRDAVGAALQEVLGGRGEVIVGGGGLHVTVLFSPGTDDRAISRAAARRGIEAPALSDYALGPLPRPGLVLGFAAVRPEEAPAAVGRLGEAIREETG